MQPAVRAETELRLADALRGGLAGDAAAYRGFLDELSGCLRAFLRRRLSGAPADVEDVLQETLLAIHNQRHTWDQGQPLTPWLYAIARYKLADFLRSRGRRDARLTPLEGVEEFLGSCDAEPAEAQRDVGRLLEQLPDHHRLPILYVKLRGLSVREAARLAGISEAAVKVGVHRGLKALAAAIRETP